MKKRTPAISVIMPSYNYAHYITEAIDSILSQTFTDFELIIIDDGSSDTTRQVLSRLKDPRIRIYFQKNHGVSFTMNRGIRLSRSKYICFLDCDDVYHPEKLARQVEMLNKGFDIVTTKVKTIDANGRFVPHSFTDEWFNNFDEKQIFGKDRKIHFLRGNYLCKSAIALRRSLFDKFGLYDTRLITAYDYDLWYKMLAKTRITRIDQPLLYYRYHGKNDSLVHSARMRAELALVYDKIINDFSHDIPNSDRCYSLYHEALSFFFQANNLYKTFSELQFKKPLYEDIFKVIEDNQWIERIQEDLCPPTCPEDSNTTGLKSIISRAKSYYKQQGLLFLIKKVLYKICPTFGRNLWKKIKKKLKTEIHWRDIRKSRNPNNKAVLFIVPWMTVGGGDKVNLDILKGLKKSHFNIHLMTTVMTDHLWKDRFSKYADRIIHLEEINDHLDRYRYILRYISEAQIQTVFVSNSGLGYDVLPLIRQKYPKINVIDLLHSQGGAKEQGGFPHYSAPFDKYIDRRITVTRYLKEFLTKTYQIDKNKITVIHNAVDTKKYKKLSPAGKTFRRTFDIPSRNFVCTYVGRLSYEKHPETVIDIADFIINKKKKRNFSFLIAGDGDLRTDLERKVCNLNLENHVFFTGNVSNPVKLYSESDTLILCSEMEGFPYVILEAMAVGLPVVSTRVGGIPEVVHDKTDGFLVPYDNNTAEKMTAVIIEIAENSRLRRSIEKNARKEIVNRFDIKQFERKYSRILS